MTLPRFIGANWKMHAAPQGFDAANSPYRSTPHADVVVFPPSLALHACKEAGLTVGGQYGRAEPSGSFTGDISMAMLKDEGCTHVLCGHSERRRHHEESDETVSQQTRAALDAGLTAVLCIGESADEHEMAMTNAVIERQLTTVLRACESMVNAANFVVAYEPVWAIGTGSTPEPNDVDAIHAYIRTLLPDQNIRIIYGGSVTGKNAATFFACKHVNGALVGGASLQPKDFALITSAA